MLFLIPWQFGIPLCPKFLLFHTYLNFLTPFSSSCLINKTTMGDYRSKSYADGKNKMQMEKYYEPQFSNDFRSNSASYATSVGAPPLPPPPQQSKDWQLKKGKSTSGSTSKSWSYNDPEFQRKRRVASYKVYSVEGKVKGSLRRSFRWFKDKYTQVIYGWR